MKIINTWQTATSREFFEVKEPVYTNGEYNIFKLWDKNYLYTFKNVAINQLGGLNREHLDALANSKRPSGKYSPSHFIFDQAIQSKAKGLKLIR